MEKVKLMIPFVLISIFLHFVSLNCLSQTKDLIRVISKDSDDELSISSLEENKEKARILEQLTKDKLGIKKSVYSIIRFSYNEPYNYLNWLTHELDDKGEISSIRNDSNSVSLREKREFHKNSLLNALDVLKKEIIYFEKDLSPAPFFNNYSGIIVVKNGKLNSALLCSGALQAKDSVKNFNSFNQLFELIY